MCFDSMSEHVGVDFRLIKFNQISFIVYYRKTARLSESNASIFVFLFGLNIQTSVAIKHRV